MQEIECQDQSIKVIEIKEMSQMKIGKTNQMTENSQQIITLTVLLTK